MSHLFELVMIIFVTLIFHFISSANAWFPSLVAFHLQRPLLEPHVIAEIAPSVVFDIPDTFYTYLLSYFNYDGYI